MVKKDGVHQISTPTYIYISHFPNGSCFRGFKVMTKQWILYDFGTPHDTPMIPYFRRNQVGSLLDKLQIQTCRNDAKTIH